MKGRVINVKETFDGCEEKHFKVPMLTGTDQLKKYMHVINDDDNIKKRNTGKTVFKNLFRGHTNTMIRKTLNIRLS